MCGNLIYCVCVRENFIYIFTFCYPECRVILKLFFAEIVEIFYIKNKTRKQQILKHKTIDFSICSRISHTYIDTKTIPALAHSSFAH